MLTPGKGHFIKRAEELTAVIEQMTATVEAGAAQHDAHVARIAKLEADLHEEEQKRKLFEQHYRDAERQAAILSGLLAHINRRWWFKAFASATLKREVNAS